LDWKLMNVFSFLFAFFAHSSLFWLGLDFDRIDS
jgi:hypothetical protein